MEIKATTLKALCAAQGNPYHEVCFDTDHLAMMRQRLADPTFFKEHTPYVYCGLASDVHPFGRSFLYTKDDTYIFHCQSYQNHNRQGLDETLATHVTARRDRMFKTYIEDECIFLGGVSIEQTPEGDPEVNDSSRPNVQGKDATSSYHVNLGELRSKVELALRLAAYTRTDDALKL